jgi:NAD(P)-dependent dehydrogenase (short-subunit alcohol dehydrogenase family)
MADSAFSLASRRILVIGAGGGIGSATARVLGSQGAQVVLADRDAPSALAAELAGAGIAASAHACDVSRRDAIDALTESAGDVDALVYLAAICPWDNWEDDGWDAKFDEVLAINLRGAVFAARAVMPGMLRRGGGRIVLVGSLAGKMGGLIASAHYVASKGGMHAVVKWLAQRGGPNKILVNGVAPASTATPMMTGRSVDLERIPLRRMSRPEEVAWPIAFLCSDAASYICGTIINVNGGVYMD